MTLLWKTAVAYLPGRFLRTAANKLSRDEEQTQKLVKSIEFLAILGAVGKEGSKGKGLGKRDH